MGLSIGYPSANARRGLEILESLNINQATKVLHNDEQKLSGALPDFWMCLMAKSNSRDEPLFQIRSVAGPVTGRK